MTRRHWLMRAAMLSLSGAGPVAAAVATPDQRRRRRGSEGVAALARLGR